MICYFCKNNKHDNCMYIPISDKGDDCSFGIILIKCECKH